MIQQKENSTKNLPHFYKQKIDSYNLTLSVLLRNLQNSPNDFTSKEATEIIKTLVLLYNQLKEIEDLKIATDKQLSEEGNKLYEIVSQIVKLIDPIKNILQKSRHQLEIDNNTVNLFYHLISEIRYDYHMDVKEEEFTDLIKFSLAFMDNFPKIESEYTSENEKYILSKTEMLTGIFHAFSSYSTKLKRNDAPLIKQFKLFICEVIDRLIPLHVYDSLGEEARTAYAMLANEIREFLSLYKHVLPAQYGHDLTLAKLHCLSMFYESAFFYSHYSSWKQIYQKLSTSESAEESKQQALEMLFITLKRLKSFIEDHICKCIIEIKQQKSKVKHTNPKSHKEVFGTYLPEYLYLIKQLSQFKICNDSFGYMYPETLNTYILCYSILKLKAAMLLAEMGDYTTAETYLSEAIEKLKPAITKNELSYSGEINICLSTISFSINFCDAILASKNKVNFRLAISLLEKLMPFIEKAEHSLKLVAYANVINFMHYCIRDKDIEYYDKFRAIAVNFLNWISEDKQSYERMLLRLDTKKTSILIRQDKPQKPVKSQYTKEGPKADTTLHIIKELEVKSSMEPSSELMPSSITSSSSNQNHLDEKDIIEEEDDRILQRKLDNIARMANNFIKVGMINTTPELGRKHAPIIDWEDFRNQQAKKSLSMPAMQFQGPLNSHTPNIFHLSGKKYIGINIHAIEEQMDALGYSSIAKLWLKKFCNQIITTVYTEGRSPDCKHLNLEIKRSLIIDDHEIPDAYYEEELKISGTVVRILLAKIPGEDGSELLYACWFMEGIHDNVDRKEVTNKTSPLKITLQHEQWPSLAYSSKLGIEENQDEQIGKIQSCFR